MNASGTDAVIHSFYNPIYGGLAGSAEGMAILAVAGFIMLQMGYMTTTHSTSPTPPFFVSTHLPSQEPLAPQIMATLSFERIALFRQS